MREKQIAVIRLLDVKIEQPRCSSFVWGITSILPLLPASLFLGGKIKTSADSAEMWEEIQGQK